MLTRHHSAMYFSVRNKYLVCFFIGINELHKNISTNMKLKFELHMMDNISGGHFVKIISYHILGKEMSHTKVKV